MKTAPPAAVALSASAMTAVFILLLGQQLPETVASHFNAAGVPDRFMPRSAFIALMLVLSSGLPLLVWGLQIAAVRGGKPKIPRADHWLAEPHRAQTIEWLSRHAAIGSAGLSAFLAHTFWLTVLAHRQTPVALPAAHFWVSLIVFLLATLAWVIWQQRQFR